MLRISDDNKSVQCQHQKPVRRHVNVALRLRETLTCDKVRLSAKP